MRRWVKITAWVSVAIALLLAIAIGTVMIIGNTHWGRTQIERLVASLSRGTVLLTGLGGRFPSHLLLDQLQLRDEQGVWLTAKRLELDWLPMAYLEGVLRVDRLQVASVDMSRLPRSSSNSGASPAIPRIDVAAASIDLVKLGPQLAGVEASLRLNGSAHLHSLRDMLFVAQAQRIDNDGEYKLHLHFDAQRMDASLELREPAGGPLENIVSLPGLGALQATLSLNGLRSQERFDLVLQAGDLKGNAQGILDLNELSGDFSFAFDSQAMTPRPDLSWQQSHLQGSWHGSTKSPKAQAHFAVDGLKMPGNMQAATLVADLAADLGKAEVHGVARGLRIPGSQPRLLESDPVKIDATVHLDDPKRPVEMLASHRLFTLKGTAVTAGAQSASLELRLPNVAPFAVYLAQDLKGSAVVDAQLDANPAAIHIKLDANAALIPGTQPWAALLGDRATLEFVGSYNDGALSVDNAKLSGHAVAVTANGSVNSHSAKARWQLTLPNLTALSPVLAGTLRASGSLQGVLTDLAADAHLSATLSVRGAQSGVITADMKVHGLPSAPEGELSAEGLLDAAPLHVNIAVQRGAKQAVHAVIHQADWRSAHAEGDVTLSMDKAQLQGQLAVTVAQLSDFQQLLGMEIAGSLAAKADLRPAGERTRAGMQIDGKDLLVRGLPGSVHVSGEGFTDSFAFKAAAQIPKLNGQPVSLTANGTLNLDADEIAVASALGNYAGQEIRLLEPVRIYFANGVAFDLLKLGAQKAELDAQGQISPTLALRISLRQVQPALVNMLLPNLLAAGAIDAHADLHGSLSAPVGEVVVNALGIQSADDAALGLPPANIHITAGLRGHTADIDAHLDAGAASRLSAVGEAPLAADGAIDMKINGKLDAGLMNAFLEARGQHAAGQLTIDATVTGSVADPQIAGSLDLAQGRINDYGRGISLTDITAQMVGKEGTLEIKSFTAAAAPGSVSMSGSIGVLQKGIPVDLKFAARNAQPIVSKLITANLNADLQIKGTARERLDITGTMHLNRTLIGIPNGLPLNVAVLDVRRRGKKQIVVADKPLVIGLDVAVQAPQEILVQGRGLDAEMGGDLQIGGTTESPVVSGGFELQRGTFSLATGRLNFTSGRVSFNGAGLKSKIDPTLDFTAQATVSDTTAIMHISGLADAPVFDFTSNPARPQDEIMALLLFGAPTQQLTPLQLAQVGAALASVSGVGGNGSLNPLVKIQRSLGLDRLKIGAGTTTNATGTDTGASIEAGRYISKRIYIEAKQSTAGTSQLEADVDLTKHLKLQTKIGNGSASVQGTTPDNDPGSSIGLFYQFEY